MKNKIPCAIKRLYASFAAIAMILAMGGCSSVFTASVQGMVADASTGAGIGAARVFLYTEEAAWNADWDAWNASAAMPDAMEKDKYGYFSSAVTASAAPYTGSYSFGTIVWDDFFPEYGKTADRKEIWLMVYHPLYGMSRNTSPVFVISDATNTVDPFVLTALP